MTKRPEDRPAPDAGSSVIGGARRPASGAGHVRSLRPGSTGSGLAWGSHALGDLADTYGTPLYVAHADVLRERYSTLRSGLERTGRSPRLCLALKANPVPSVLSCLAKLGCGATVMSEQEISLAHHAGVPESGVIVHGLSRKAGLAEAAVRSDPWFIVVESLAGLDRVVASASGTPGEVRLGLRIDPGIRSGWGFTKGGYGPAGFGPAGQAYGEALDRIARAEGLRLEAIAFHIGTGLHDAAVYVSAIRSAADAWARARAHGHQPSVLDIGGGLGLPTVSARGPLGMIAALKARPRSRPPVRPASETILGAVSDSVRKQFGPPGPGSPRTVVAELGRALSGPAQILLLTVVDVGAGRSRRFAVCDGGSMSLTPLLLAERHDLLPVAPRSGAEHHVYDLAGDTPAPLDVVAPGIRLPELMPGDRLAVLDTGAYFVSLATNFSGPRPAIVMLDGDTHRLVQRRETFDDLRSRDVEAPASANGRPST